MQAVSFPKDGLKPGSTQYLKKNALGLDFLTDVYSASYAKGSQEFTAFLKNCKSETEAKDIEKKFANYYKSFGTLIKQGKEGETSFVFGEVAGFHDFVFRKGSLIAGVNAIEDKQAAEKWGRWLMRVTSHRRH